MAEEEVVIMVDRTLPKGWAMTGIFYPSGKSLGYSDFFDQKRDAVSAARREARGYVPPYGDCSYATVVVEGAAVAAYGTAID
jgi:hypothetical protein